MPTGIKCLIAANKGVTILRDKTGKVITAVNSLLPGGNRMQVEDKVTLLQGVYHGLLKVLYVTDIMMWSDELLIDLPGYSRIQVAFERINSIPEISKGISENNEIMIRFPNVYCCSKEGLYKSYYGLYAEHDSSIFNERYVNLVNYVLSNNLITPQMITNKEIPSICSMFGYDNIQQAYIKDGIAFIHKESSFVFGFTSECLIWKTKEIAPLHFDRLMKHPMTAKLIFGDKKRLCTYDGFDIINYEDSEGKLIINSRYVVEFKGVTLLDNWKLELHNVRVLKEASSVIWDTTAKITTKCIIGNKSEIKYENIEKTLT